MSILFDKPLFKLRLSGYGSRYMVSLNDVAMYIAEQPDVQIDTELPVNHYMHPEKNVISIELIPDEPGDEINKNTRVLVELFVGSINPSYEKEYKVTDIVYTAGKNALENTNNASLIAGPYSFNNGFVKSDDGKINVGEIRANPLDFFEGAYSVRREIHIPNSLPLWAFFNSDKIVKFDLLPEDEYEQAKRDAYPAIQRIQEALARKNEKAIDEIMPLFEERSRETDQAFYLQEGETQKGLRDEFLYNITNKNKVLVGLDVDYVAPIVEENQLLMSFKRNENSNAIVFNDNNYNGSSSFPISFRLKDGEWIITR